MIEETVATLLAVAGAAAVASGTRRWRLVGPTDDPTPFESLLLPVDVRLLGTLLWSAPAIFVAAGWIAGGWWWVSFAALAVALTAPLIEIGAISAEVVVAEREVSRASGAITGHGDVHSVTGPVEGRLYRAAQAARVRGHERLADELDKEAGRARRAEREAARRREAEGGSSARTDRYTEMLQQVRLRPNRQFSDPANMPARWTDRQRAAWAPFARRLDAVRAIHTHQIEWIALYALVWVRPLLVAALPALPDWATSGLRPPGETGTFADVVWVAALAVSSGVALLSPRIVPELQRKDVEVIPLCRRLLVLEAPLWLLLIATSPSWVAWSFGAMAFTLVERPGWSARNAVITAGTGVLVLVASLVLRDAGVGHVAVEALAAAALLFLVSTSYGLLFPLVVDRLLFADRRSRSAERRLEKAIADGARDELLGVTQRAGRLVRASGMTGQEAESVLALSTTTPRRPGRWPRTETLEAIVDDAVAPLTPGDRPDDRLQRVRYEPETAARTIVQRGARRPLERVVKAMVGEADRHAVGVISVSIVVGRDEVRIRVVDRPDPDDPPGGFQEGTRIITAEVAKLPGGALDGPPGLRTVFSRGRERQFWVAEAVCSNEILRRTDLDALQN